MTLNIRRVALVKAGTAMRLPVSISDALLTALMRIEYVLSSPDIANHPELKALDRTISRSWDKTFTTMRQAVNTVAKEISHEQGIKITFHIYKNDWGAMAKAMDVLKEKCPGDNLGSPNGAERAMRYAESIALRKQK